jgi:hypothetical protein
MIAGLNRLIAYLEAATRSSSTAFVAEQIEGQIGYPKDPGLNPSLGKRYVFFNN